MTTLRYILLTARRDWLFLGMFVFMALITACSFFLGSTALVEQRAMSIVYSAGAIRLLLMVGMVIYVCFYIRRAFENKEIDVLLTRPISRTQLVLAYYAGFLALGILLTLPFFALMAAIPQVSKAGLLWWGISLWAEMGIIIAFALALALMLRSAVTSVLVGFGFYLAARMMGFFTLMLQKPFVLEASFSLITQSLLRLCAILLPRLDLFAQTEWLIYGFKSSSLFLAQAGIYIPLLLALAVIDFKRREF